MATANPRLCDVVTRLHRLAMEVSTDLADLAIVPADESTAYRLRLARAYALALEEEIAALASREP